MTQIWLTNKRKKLKKNYTEMARYLGLPLTTYMYYEKGYRKPSVSQAKILAEKLGVNWTIFFED